MNEAGGAARGPLAVATGNGLAPRPSCRAASSSRRPCRLSLREERGESGMFPVEGTQGIGILPFGNAVYWRGEQTPSQLQVLPRTPCRRPAGTQRTPQISADTPQIPDRDPRTPCGHPTETRRHPADTPQRPADTPQVTRRRPADAGGAPAASLLEDPRGPLRAMDCVARSCPCLTSWARGSDRPLGA